GAGGDSGDGDRRPLDDAVPQPDERADPGERQVAGRVRELLVGAAAGVRGVDADVGDDLVLGQVRRVDALEEVVEDYLTRTRARGDDDLRVQGEEDRGKIGGRVAVRHGAADCAPGADLRVGEDREGVREGRDPVVEARDPVDEGGGPGGAGVTVGGGVAVGCGGGGRGGSAVPGSPLKLREA